MSYLVFARKYRPQTFEQVVGQKPVVKTLQNSLKRGRVAHAILFSGVRGVGKTTLAQIVARELGVGFRMTSGPVLAKAGVAVFGLHGKMPTNRRKSALCVRGAGASSSQAVNRRHGPGHRNAATPSAASSNRQRTGIG